MHLKPECFLRGVEMASQPRDTAPLSYHYWDIASQELSPYYSQWY